MTELSTEIAVLAPGEKTLAELAEIANREHGLMVDSGLAMLDHASKAGEALLVARERIGSEGWQTWVDETLKFGRAQASRYMRFAYYKDQLPAELFRPYEDRVGNLRPPSLTRALPYLKGLPNLIESGPGRRSTPAVRTEAQRLRDQDLTYEEIAELLDISRAHARRICDPVAAEQHKRTNKLAQRRARAARNALKEQERRNARDIAAKQAGDARGETYSLIRKALDEAQRAIMAANDPEERSALRETMSKLHQAEDAIAKALKVPPS